MTALFKLLLLIIGISLFLRIQTKCQNSYKVIQNSDKVSGTGLFLVPKKPRSSNSNFWFRLFREEGGSVRIQTKCQTGYELDLDNCLTDLLFEF